MLLTSAITTAGQPAPDFSAFRQGKKIPTAIEKNVLTALSFYPELKSTTIDFNYKAKIKGSVMQAQPVPGTLLGSRKHRRYRINISEHFGLIHTQMPITDIPDTVMIGWIGHELGHVLDYERRSNRGMIAFGIRYYLHPSYVKQAERAADFFAVEHGMGHYIIATKHFILDNADLPQAYKDKIRRLYLSPDVIVEQVRKLEEAQQQHKLP